MARPAALPAAHYVLMRRLRRSLARRPSEAVETAPVARELTPTTAPRPATPAERPVRAAIARDIASAPPSPPDRVSSRRLQIADNARGRGFHFLFASHFKGATDVAVQDRYLRSHPERLRELAVLARSMGVAKIKVTTTPWKPGDGAEPALSAAATEPDPLAALAQSVGGIAWEFHDDTLHHDRQVRVFRPGGGVTIDLGRGLDMYYAPWHDGENLDDSETLRARETVVWTRSWSARVSERAKGPGASAVARSLADRPLRKLRRVAQHLRDLQRKLFTGMPLDQQQQQALFRQPAVELALAWRRPRKPEPARVLGESWKCPNLWCRAVNRGEHALCRYYRRGCRGIRDADRFAVAWSASKRVQHWWRCVLFQKYRSRRAEAAAAAAAREARRLGLVAFDERATQTTGGGMGRLVVTSDAATQAATEPQRAERTGERPNDVSGDRKRPRLQPAVERREPGVMAWQGSAARMPPSVAEVDRTLSSMRRSRRERREPRPPIPLEAPVRPAEQGLCIWGCGARLVPGQFHSCGNTAERRLPRPPASPALTFGPPAPELCPWCGLPLMLADGESHACGGRAVAETANDDEDI